MHVFAQARVPIVRYATPPELCAPNGGCTALEYSGVDITGFLAPRLGPDFELIVFRTPAEAQQLVLRASTFRRRSNVLLYTGRIRDKARLGRVLAAFAKIAR
jgi:hypothetical protein